MICQSVNHNSNEYLLAVELRREVLRYPLGLDFTQEELDAESNAHHFVLMGGTMVLATAMAIELGNGEAQVRQVAVSFANRGRGFGREIMHCAEDCMRANGSRSTIVHAREVVLEFYFKLGYMPFGEPFEEVGIPHRKMRKSLASSNGSTKTLFAI